MPLAIPLNNVSGLYLAAAHTSGSTTLALNSGAGAAIQAALDELGVEGVSEETPIRVTVVKAAAVNSFGQITQRSQLTVFLVTGRDGDTLTGCTPTEGTTDDDYAPGDRAGSFISAGSFLDIHQALTGKLGPTDPIQSSQLPGSGVSPGTYQLASVSVDSKGRITSATPDPALTWDGTAKKLGAPTVDHGTQGGTVDAPALHVLWMLQPITPGTAKWGSTCGTADFNTYKDETHYHGLNPDESVPTEPRIVWGIETNYYEAASGRLTAEFYSEYRSPGVGGPSPRYQRRPFGCTIDKLTGSVSSSVELGPAFSTFGKFSIRGGPSNGGDFSIATFTTGTDSATSSTLITSPLTVQRATTLQSTLAVTGDTTAGGIVNVAKSGADGAYNEVLRAQIPGNLGTGNWRNTIESSCSSNAVSSGWRFKCATGQASQATVLTLSGNGNATIAGGLSVGGGATIPKILRASATLAFPSVAAGGQQELTISVTGATAGAPVAFGPPAGLESGLVASARVSATDTVAVRLANPTASPIAPASATYHVDVFNL